jgi:retron-type reverse transcriptase
MAGESVGIKINDDIGHYFHTHKGLWQGDPMSPILFNIVADMLSVLIKRAKDDDQINGVIIFLALWKMGCLFYNM